MYINLVCADVVCACVCYVQYIVYLKYMYYMHICDVCVQQVKMSYVTGPERTGVTYTQYTYS